MSTVVLATATALPAPVPPAPVPPASVPPALPPAAGSPREEKDARTLSLFQAAAGADDVAAHVLAELRARIVEELDYALEADAQRAFAAAYADDPDVLVPRVVASAPKVLVSEWIDGVPLARVIAAGARAERDHAGRLLALLHFSAPERVRMLHADPHPGNFFVENDGRIGVVDFGMVGTIDDRLRSKLGAVLIAITRRPDTSIATSDRPTPNSRFPFSPPIDSSPFRYCLDSLTTYRRNQSRNHGVCDTISATATIPTMRVPTRATTCSARRMVSIRVLLGLWALGFGS